MQITASGWLSLILDQMRLVLRSPFLWLLITTDLLIIGAHLSYSFPELPADRYFSIEHERSLGESFQHVKTWWLVLVHVFLVWRLRSLRYVAWAFVAAYLLIDDMTRIHEEAGDDLGRMLAPWALLLSIQARDFGEIVIGIFSGAVCLTVIALSLVKAPADYWRHSASVVVGLLCLGLFGVGVDGIQALVSFNWGSDTLIARILGSIEDGGEMLAMSLLLATSTLAVERR